MTDAGTVQDASDAIKEFCETVSDKLENLEDIARIAPKPFKMSVGLVLATIALSTLFSSGLASAQGLPTEDILYAIESRQSGLFLDVLGRNPGELARITQYESQVDLSGQKKLGDPGNEGVQQIWKFERVAGQPSYIFKIKSNFSGRYMTGIFPHILGYGGTGRYIGQTAEPIAGNQNWCLEDAGEGYFRIRSCDPDVLAKYEPVYLDVIGQNMHNEATLGLYVKTQPGYQQMWRLLALSAPPAPADVIAGTSVGQWEVACSALTCASIAWSQGVSRTNTSEKSWSKEETKSLTKSLSVGVEYSGFSSQAGIESTRSSVTSEAKRLANSSTTEWSKSCTTAGSFDFQKQNIGVVYQWVVTTPMGDKNFEIKTCIVTCAPDGEHPELLHPPMTRASIDACRATL